MATPDLTIFKYQHSDRVVPSGVGWLAFLAFLAVLAISIYFLGPGGIIVTVIGAIVSGFAWPKRRLCVGMRYLICGNTVVYYANIRKMVLTHGKGDELVLHWGTNGTFKLERERFPTNARKAPKIEKNKTAKFEKVSNGIIRRVLLAAPAVELVGIDRAKVVKKGGS